MRLQVPEQALILLVRLLLIIDYPGIIVLPVGDHLAHVIQDGCLGLRPADFPQAPPPLYELGDLIPGYGLAEFEIIGEVVGALGLLDA